MRLRARAIRRTGELLKEYDGRPDNNPEGKTQKAGAQPLGSKTKTQGALSSSKSKSKGDHTSAKTQKEATEEAGLRP